MKDEDRQEVDSWPPLERAAGVMLNWDTWCGWKKVIRARNLWRSCRTQSGRSNSKFGRKYVQAVIIQKILAGEEDIRLTVEDRRPK